MSERTNAERSRPRVHAIRDGVKLCDGQRIANPDWWLAPLNLIDPQVSPHIRDQRCVRCVELATEATNG